MAKRRTFVSAMFGFIRLPHCDVASVRKSGNARQEPCMICGRVAHFSIVRRFLARPGRYLAVLLLASWGHVNVASAAETVDCASINMGRLDVAPTWGSGKLRTVELKEGDTLAFTFRADTRATGTITLVAGDGREKSLFYGSHATQVSYTAERSGKVGFRFTTKGGKVATFVTTCDPARGSGAMALDGLMVDMRAPLSFATASKHSTATSVATPSASDPQWLGGEQPGKEAADGTYGVKLGVQPALMIGVLAKFERARDPLLGPSALSDQLWQAGPVTTLRLGGGLSLDARAAWGPADPVIGRAADRQTLDARLTSKQEAGPWRFSPSVGFAHVLERLGAAAEHSGVPSEQTVELGRIDVKPELAYRLETGHSMYVEPKFMLGTLWNLGDAATIGIATGARHMAETGITFGAADGTMLQVGGGVQEGETRSDSVWSGKMQLNIPLK